MSNFSTSTSDRGPGQEIRPRGRLMATVSERASTSVAFSSTNKTVTPAVRSSSSVSHIASEARGAKPSVGSSAMKRIWGPHAGRELARASAVRRLTASQPVACDVLRAGGNAQRLAIADRCWTAAHGEVLLHAEAGKDAAAFRRGQEFRPGLAGRRASR